MKTTNREPDARILSAAHHAAGPRRAESRIRVADTISESRSFLRPSVVSCCLVVLLSCCLVVLLSLSAPAICICICICQPHLFSSQQLLDMDPAGCRIHPAHPITRRLTLSHRDYVIASSPNRLMQCLQRKHEMVGPPPNTSPRLFGSTAQMNQLVYCTPLLLLHHHDSQPRGPSRNQCF
ncbi:hypothetical protein HBI38_021950 [Parastagonospora nodorum]|nr:hypothetical protein HBH50_033250 [Parastagonospora nodorum]KAH4097107.1 hypothetical protein HBH48_042130 [Parastagonospora nodorum]KAH4120971.1 hypothetical protein HBH47_106030 [Parastagonospora nodorum]KAH6278378.1 hypothetical protein HBI41_042050 [Parastagonospora nodorum]KAH6304158.1 hypothetical protein HBI40_016350 [Parastagonospora nodorum]